MLEAIGDVWTYPAEWRVVTTNGIVKQNGELVMGAGVAREAAQRYPPLPLMLGDKVRRYGNHVYAVCQFRLASFPTKHHYRERANLALIQQSACELVAMLDLLKGVSVVLPRPGCGLGRLEWADVRPTLSQIFDNRFVVVHPSVAER